jgi:hypothetical protein
MHEPRSNATEVVYDRNGTKLLVTDGYSAPTSHGRTLQHNRK